MPSGAPDNPPGSTRSPRGGGSARLAVSLPLLRRAGGSGLDARGVLLGRGRDPRLHGATSVSPCPGLPPGTPRPPSAPIDVSQTCREQTGVGERAHNNNIPESCPSRPSAGQDSAASAVARRRSRGRRPRNPRPARSFWEPTRWILGVSGRFYAQEGEQTAGAAWAGCIDEQCIGHVP